jgi:transcription elongation factor GreA
MNAVPADQEETLLVTRSGYEHLRAEIATLTNEARPGLIDRVREARADGDLTDNPALYEALEEQAQLEHRIAELEGRLASARIVEPNGDGTAGIGNAVRLRNLGTSEIVEYELVGGIEANIGNGRVSVEAPVGRALVGTEAGEVVEVQTPRGTVEFEVIYVSASTARKAA